MLHGFTGRVPEPRIKGLYTRSSSIDRSLTLSFSTSEHLRPVNTKVKMIARARSPAGVSGITASSFRTCSAVSPVRELVEQRPLATRHSLLRSAARGPAVGQL